MFKNAHPRLASLASSIGVSMQNKRLQRLIDTSRNRWTGKPHEHKREIARRHRQAETIAQRAHVA